MPQQYSSYDEAFSAGRGDAIGERKIPYIPSLDKAVKSTTGAILLQQIIYWLRAAAKRAGDGRKWHEMTFYKFREPCDHKDYHPGQSWTEELGWSANKFSRALDKIAHPLSDKDGQTIHKKSVEYWITRDRVTHYRFVLKNYAKLEVDSNKPECVPHFTYNTERTIEDVNVKTDEPRDEPPTPKSSRKFSPNDLELSRRFLLKQQANFPNVIKKIPPKLIEDGAFQIALLQRVDGHTFQQIRDTLLWVVTHPLPENPEKSDFSWARAIKSPASLRNKCTDGLTKFQGALASAEEDKQKQNKAPSAQNWDSLPAHVQRSAERLRDMYNTITRRKEPKETFAAGAQSILKVYDSFTTGFKEWYGSNSGGGASGFVLRFIHYMEKYNPNWDTMNPHILQSSSLEFGNFMSWFQKEDADGHNPRKWEGIPPPEGWGQ